MISFLISFKHEQIRKIEGENFKGQSISYEEAETVLFKLGFQVRSKGSHHIFFKSDYPKHISIKKRSQLLPYQIALIAEVFDEKK